MGDQARILWILWIAMTTSIVLYVGVVFLLASGMEEVELNPLFANILYVQALLLGAGSVAYRRRALSDEGLQAKLMLENGETAPGRLLSSYLTVTVIGLALHEAIALFGLVLGFIANDPFQIVPFAGAAIFLNVLIIPRPGELVERAQKLALFPVG